MRNAAATGLLARRLAAPLVAAVPKTRGPGGRSCGSSPATTTSSSSPGRCARPRPPPASIDGLEGSTVVSTMARNGVEFGIRVAGHRRPLVHRARPASSRASTSPASAPPTPTSTPATPRSWRRTGSAAWPWPRRPPCRRSSAPSRSPTRVATTREMAEICVGAQPPVSDRRAATSEGTPTGIDIRRVVQTGIVPKINTAIAHARAPRMIGAGIATPPIGAVRGGAASPSASAIPADAGRRPSRDAGAARWCGAPSTRTRWC